MTRHRADLDRRSEWDDLRARHLAPADQRPPSAGRGVHHLALLSRDVEKTIAFYQDLLEFPLTELFENRDYQGSTHFFFDIGHNNLLAFFDFPGLDLGDYAEMLGGLHHLAISVEPEQWEHLKDKLSAAGVPYQHMSGSSLYFNGPDGERLELVRDRSVRCMAQIAAYSVPTTTYRGVAVQDIMIRIETDDFEAWKTQHYLHAQNRASYGITDGPAYQDLDNPNAALFHIKTDDMDRAMEWFKSDTFKEASRLAKVTGRTFYLAQPQAR
jgi:catechol 2,3-dioxygenase-like lactoylglutathione lyase family enzyme